MSVKVLGTLEKDVMFVKVRIEMFVRIGVLDILIKVWLSSLGIM